MSLTASEEERLAAVEQNLAKLFKLLDGATSKNTVNRWYIVLRNEISRIETKVTDLVTSVQSALELARKLQ